MRYDTIIVGGGTAGCVLAARLSEDPGRQVLLLEAGPDLDPNAAGGVASANFLHAVAEPDRVWHDLAARRNAEQTPRPYVRGRGIGGSASINAMVTLPGRPDDYDRWASLGAFGWGWDDVAPTLQRLDETLPLSIVPSRHWGAVDLALAECRRERIEPARLAMRHGQRESVVDVYLQPARTRPNLTVRPDSPVGRVLLDGARATGVVLADGTEIDGAEVVVACGAIHSPGVLLRSGVARPGIGTRLKDHPSLRLVLDLKPGERVTDVHRPAASVLSRMSSGEIDDDLQLVPLNLTGTTDDGRRYGALIVALMQVHSSGKVTPIGPDALSPPRVELDLLADERDLRRLRIGFMYLLTLAGHPAVKLIADEVYVDDRGTRAADLAGAADDDLDAWMRANLADYVHAAGTCAMGAPDDDDAVVDPQGRVIGYHGLRVCDASVFPDLPRANTNLSTVMVAERVAAMMADR